MLRQQGWVEEARARRMSDQRLERLPPGKGLQLGGIRLRQNTNAAQREPLRQRQPRLHRQLKLRKTRPDLNLGLLPSHGQDVVGDEEPIRAGEVRRQGGFSLPRFAHEGRDLIVEQDGAGM